MTVHRYPLLFAVAMLLAGCAAGSGSLPDTGAPRGYLYHDANHPNDVNNASPQAIYNASHGTWLWPPETVDWP
jgi:hypothetical protein